MMQKKDLDHLLYKYQNNQLSEDEKSILFDFLEKTNSWEYVYSIWNDDTTILPLQGDEDGVHIFHQVVQDARLETTQKSTKIIGISRNQFVAACISVLLLSTVVLFLYRAPVSSNLVAEVEKTEITPGSKLARMQFEDGSFIEFDKIKKDTVLADKGMRIKVSPDGNISYDIIAKANALTYTSVYTPRGGEYTLVLADGSKVWLNSESKIKYPIEFDDQVREVEIEGEAYFKVASKYVNNKKIPFKVKTRSQTVEVLGTEFNVNAYDPVIYTTLVEGAVALYDEAKINKILLTPNQQCIYDASKGQMQRLNVDTYYFTSWLNGKFAFQKATIYKVMADLSRWYNVEVNYQGDFSKMTYSGTISRLENFDEVLKLIELTNKLKFKTDGRRITVIKL